MSIVFIFLLYLQNQTDIEMSYKSVKYGIMRQEFTNLAASRLKKSSLVSKTLPRN